MAKKGQEVTVREASSLLAQQDVPDYLKGYRGALGTEDIQGADLTIPRLKIGQDMTPLVQDGEVERGDLFLNLTGDVVSPAGERLPFIVLAKGVEFILWRPKKDNGGGILNRARPVQTPDGVRYKWDIPNTAFKVKVEGLIEVEWKCKTYIDEDGLDEWGSEIPGKADSKKAATKHFNYVILLPTKGGLVVGLSLSKTAAGPAKDFNGMMKIGSQPLQARIFTIETVDDQRDKHNFKNFKFRNGGFVPSQEEFARYQQLASTFATRISDIDQSDGGEEVVHDERA